MRLLIFFLLVIACNQAYTQSCSGSLGDAIVNFDFGAGSNPGAQVAATNYLFTSSDCPPDGSYTVRNNTSGCFGNTWHSLTQDHTGNANGYFMLINASVAPSTFYIDTVRGLCPNTTYEFAAWILNEIVPSACNGNSNQPNITFSIEKTDGSIIQTYSSGNIPPTNSPTWIPKATFFTTAAGVTDVVLRMVNNAAGGCGNDLALDDITFRPCGPLLTPSIANPGGQNTSVSFCEGQPKTYTLNCIVSAGYTNPVYQWQQSFNNGAYTDIIGQNATSTQVQFAANAPVGMYKYRLQVAEAGNFASAQCRISSSPISITINRNPSVIVTGNSPVCEHNNIVLSASGGNSYDWQGPANFTSTQSQPIIQNALVQNAGNYIVTATAASGCFAQSSVNITVNPTPLAIAIALKDTICEGVSTTLQANGGNTYSWFPVQFLSTPMQQNTLASPLQNITYNVEVKNSFGCADTASVNLVVLKKPIVNAGVDQITVAGKPIQLVGTISGNFRNFSWSPNSFITDINSLTPVVTPPGDFRYILTAVNNCGGVSDSIDIRIYNGIFIPNAFTPNGDGKNDTWNIPSLEAYPLHTMTVFNRYGEIVFQRKQSFDAWDGKYKGQILPAGAYNYLIDLKNGSAVLKGSFLLIK